MRGFSTAEKNAIVRMRKNGCGYASIAKEFGCTKDRIRQFCRLRGLDGFADKSRFGEVKMQCEECGIELESPGAGRHKRFCGSKCRYKWWYKHRDELKGNPELLYHKTCPICDRNFSVHYRASQVCCSRECSWELMYGKEKTAEQGVV